MLISESFKYEDIIGFKFGSSPIGKPKIFSHIYYIDGLLIDTGNSKMCKTILSKTNDLQINQILITHHHEDHSGNIYPIQVQHHCPVYASDKCCDLMKDPPEISFAQKLTWGQRRLHSF